MFRTPTQTDLDAQTEHQKKIQAKQQKKLAEQLAKTATKLPEIKESISATPALAEKSDPVAPENPPEAEPV